MKIVQLAVFTISVISLFNVCPVRAASPLDEYLVQAAENNPGLKAKFAAYQAALEQVPQIGSLPDPQVMFGYFIRPMETRVGPQRARISASQMFPWFGTLGLKKNAAAALAKVKYETFAEAKSRLFFDVKSTYYNLYFAAKAIRISEENIGILSTFRSLALIKVESGLASSVDVLRVEMEIADLENQLALLHDNFWALRTTFNNLLDVSGDAAITLPDTLVVPDVAFSTEAALDSIRTGNHLILQSEYMEASFRKQELAAKKMGMPNFSVGFDYVFVGKSSNPMAPSSESGKDAFVFPTIGLSIPIYRHKYTAMVKEAVLQQQSQGSERRDRINMLETAFAKTNKEYLDAVRRIPLYKEQSNKADRALGILRTEYETSGKNFEEVLRIERQLLQYELNIEKARSDKGASVAFIGYLMGK
jgi:cobalt-zinc-cadmium efflux system outer membrane protein